MQIFKYFLIFTLVLNSAMAQRCDQQLIENLKTAANQNLADSENFQKLLNQRAELALIKSSLVFWKLQQNVKGKKEYLRQLEDQLEEHHRKTGYTRPTSWAMIRYLKEKLELASFQEEYSQEELQKIVEENSYKRLTGQHTIADDLMINIRLKEQEEYPIEKLNHQMFMRALAAPSYVLFPKDKDKHLNSTDVYLLRKALKTDNKGNPTLLDFTLKQMKKHFSERNFPVNDEKAMNDARVNTVKKFKETFAKEIADSIPSVMKKLDENCKDELKALLSPENRLCAAAIIIENNFSDFEKILTKLSEKPEVQGIFLHVAGAKSTFNCAFIALPDGSYELDIDTELTNFEGINKSIWNFEAGSHKIPIKNKEARTTFQFSKKLTFKNLDSIPKKGKFSHNEMINARLDITQHDTQKMTNEVDLTKCTDYPSGTTPTDNSDGEDTNTDNNNTDNADNNNDTNTNNDTNNSNDTNTDNSNNTDDDEPEDDRFKLGLEREFTETHVKLKIKEDEKFECAFATCNSKQMKAGKKGCKLIKEQEKSFKRKVDKGFNVYFQCREKGNENAKFEPHLSKSGKEVKQYIGECDSVKCLSLPTDNYRAPVIPPPPPQSPQQNIPIPDMPILLEG